MTSIICFIQFNKLLFTCISNLSCDAIDDSLTIEEKKVPKFWISDGEWYSRVRMRRVTYTVTGGSSPP